MARLSPPNLHFSMSRANCFSVCLILIGLVVVSAACGAHTLRPVQATLAVAAQGDVQLTLRGHIEAVLAGLQSRHDGDTQAQQRYDMLRALTTTRLAQHVRNVQAKLIAAITVEFDAAPATLTLQSVKVGDVDAEDTERETQLIFVAQPMPDAHTVTWQARPPFGATFFRVVPPRGIAGATQWLAAGQRSEPVALAQQSEPRSRWYHARHYLELGFTHILPGGLDHVLFVLGIFLLTTKWGALLWQVTAFTLAHSLTLALGLFGVMQLATHVVEPLIALSIVYIAVENIIARQLKPWRVAVVFAFGLLHGLGFAGVLRQLDMPDGQFVTALVTFNVGVELGQLAVLAIAFITLGQLARDPHRFRRLVTIPGSLIIACVAGIWSIARIAA